MRLRNCNWRMGGKAKIAYRFPGHCGQWVSRERLPVMLGGETAGWGEEGYRRRSVQPFFGMGAERKRGSSWWSSTKMGMIRLGNWNLGIEKRVKIACLILWLSYHHVPREKMPLVLPGETK